MFKPNISYSSARICRQWDPNSALFFPSQTLKLVIAGSPIDTLADVVWSIVKICNMVGVEFLYILYNSYTIDWEHKSFHQLFVNWWWTLYIMYFVLLLLLRMVKKWTDQTIWLVVGKQIRNSFLLFIQDFGSVFTVWNQL